MSVSEESTKAIYAAIERLKRWEPKESVVLQSGDLTTINLATEAGVSRPTLYRATVALEEWNTYLKNVEESRIEALAPRARVRQLEREIQKLRTTHAAEAASLRDLSNTLAQQVQLLTLELERCRRQGPGGQILSIDRTR